MVIGFVIWSIIAVIFIMIGISAWKSKQEVGFFTFSKPPTMNDVIKYNHAVGKLWFIFALILEVIGIPFMFIEQNFPLFILMILGVMLLVITIIISYLKIEKRIQTIVTDNKKLYLLNERNFEFVIKPIAFGMENLIESEYK